MDYKQIQHLFLAAISAATILLPSAALAKAGSADKTNATTNSSDALLSEAHGNVYKRGFVDWNREEWSDPQPASVGDVLHEGMQVGTGDKSWAQIAWRHITTRAWARSVYAIAPNQRLVYLINGEMLFQLDKKRKDSNAYCVWTNLLQARIRGTTVLCQATKNTSRITVLEGTIDVLNRKDHSLVRLTPGCVYEVSAKADGQNDSAAVAASERTTDFTRITSEKFAASEVFDTAKTTSRVYVADPAALLDHPLLSGFGSALPSFPLVKSSLDKVTALLGSTVGDATKLLTSSGELLQSVNVLNVPKSLSYKIGPQVGKLIPIAKNAAIFFPPAGVIGAAEGVLPTGVLPVSTPNSLLPGTGTTFGALPQNLNGALTPGTLTPALSPSISNTAGIGAITGIGATVAGTVGGIVGPAGGGGSIINGVTGTVGGAVGGALGGGGGGLSLPLGGGLPGLP